MMREGPTRARIAPRRLGQRAKYAKGGEYRVIFGRRPLHSTPWDICTVVHMSLGGQICRP